MAVAGLNAKLSVVLLSVATTVIGVVRIGQVAEAVIGAGDIDQRATVAPSHRTVAVFGPLPVS